MLIRDMNEEWAICNASNKKYWGYCIPKKDLETYEGLVHWIYHLAGKNWITTEHIEELIEKSGLSYFN